MGGLEILVLGAIIGGILGIFFRDKRRAAWVGFALGAIGAMVTSYVLVELVFASLLLIPVYSVLGSWLFNYVSRKI